MRAVTNPSRRQFHLAAALVCVPGFLQAATRGGSTRAAGAGSAVVGPVPSSLKLPKFYTQHVDAGGLPVVASSAPLPQSLLAARGLVLNMLAHRADILAALVKAKVRVAVIGATEVTTDIPEYASLVPADFWNSRTRGVGATRTRPVCSAGEENLLGLTPDRYTGESILVHEFAHTLFEMGARTLKRSLDLELDELYQSAMAAGLWQATYAATNYREYWAEGVQCWFNANPRARTANGIHGPVSTREDLLAYDPALARFIRGVLGDSTWRWERPGAHALA